MDLIVLVGRILLSLTFLASGLMGHLGERKQMSRVAASQGVPAAETVVPLAGIMMIIGSLMVILGIFGDLGALLMILFLIPTTFVMHAFWKLDDPQQKMMQQTIFTKNLAVLGGALLAFVLFAYTGDTLGFTFTGPLLDL